MAGFGRKGMTASEPSAETPIRRYRLDSRNVRTFIGLLFFGGSGIFFVVMSIAGPERLPVIRLLPLDKSGMALVTLALAAASLAMAGLIAWAYWLESRGERWIVLDSAQVSGPVSMFSRRQVRIPVAELRVKITRMHGGAGWAALRGGNGAKISLGSAYFESDAHFWEFVQELDRMRMRS